MAFNKVKVIIPIYHEQLTETEKISLMQCKRILKRHSLCIIKPDSLSLQMEEIQGMEIEEFEEKWFKGIKTYNALMLSEQFYERFLDCEYILIYQLDAFVFRDELYEFCALGYDYIGAPWLYGQFIYSYGIGGYYYTGNGGFSLRRVRSHLEILKRDKVENGMVEDMFFASRKTDEFKIAPVEVALKFSFEINVKKCFEINNCELPFGCHAWQKYDFSFYRKIFQEYGYDTANIQDGKWDRDKCDSRYDLSGVTEEKLKEALKSLLPGMMNEIWIWGAGQIGKECGWQMAENHIDIKGFIDKKVQLYKTKLFGKKISSPNKYFEDTSRTPLIIAMSYVPEEIRNTLNRYKKVEGIDYVSWNALYDFLGERIGEK